MLPPEWLTVASSWLLHFGSTPVKVFGFSEPPMLLLFIDQFILVMSEILAVETEALTVYLPSEPGPVTELT